MLEGFRQARRGEQFRARLVDYADDFASVSRGYAAAALEGREGRWSGWD